MSRPGTERSRHGRTRQGRSGGPPGQGGSRTGLAADIRGGVTLRAFLLVCGVGLLQLAFIASYIGAFHHPRPHQVPIAVVAPASAAPRLVRELSALPGRPLTATAVSSPAAGVARLREQASYGVLEVSPASKTDRLVVASASGPAAATAVTTVLRASEARQGRRLTVTDIRPPAAGDHDGLSAFYLVIGWMVGGYLVASILGVSVGARPENLNRAGIRLAAVALYAAVTGLGGTLIVGPWLHALPAHTLALWGLGALVVFAAGAFTTALMVIAGTVGIGLAILVFVVLGNPSAGGAYAWSLLPGFWRVIGPWLPTGAGTAAVRGIAYFGGANVTTDLLVVAGYAAAGLLVTFLVLGLMGRPLVGLGRPERGRGRLDGAS
jgi:hypothetical protein